MIILFILGLILLAAGGLILAKNYNPRTYLAGILIAAGTILQQMAIDMKFDSERPSALDVYQGKTELRITSVNGVPQDTVVVYKTNEK